MEEQRGAPWQQWNKDKIKPTFKISDVIKAHVQVQSNADQGEVEKLSYQAQGPFKISKIFGNISYEVKRYNKPDSAVRKYKGRE